MKKIGIFGLALLTTLVACDSPVATEDHAAGVVLLRADGTEAARFMLAGRAVTGALTVRAGQTADYTARVVTESGQIEEIDGIEYSVSNPVVVIGLAANIAVQGKDRIVVTGLDAGTTGRQTSIRFDLNHAGHLEFTASDIPLTVQLP